MGMLEVSAPGGAAVLGVGAGGSAGATCGPVGKGTLPALNDCAPAGERGGAPGCPGTGEPGAGNAEVGGGNGPWPAAIAAGGAGGAAAAVVAG